MKKRYKVLGTAIVMTAALAVPAFAMPTSVGGWIQDSARPVNVNGISNWWYQNPDGSYPKNAWVWLDGNKDGVSECYRFDENGWMYASTKVDGYDVNESGAWLSGGSVQTKRTDNSTGNGAGGSTSTGSSTGETGKNQWVNDGKGKRYVDANGKFVTGWKTFSGKKYYFGSDGYALTGYQDIDGKEYYFYSSGAMATSTVHDSSDGLYYVLDKKKYYVVDIVDESDWTDYRRNADRSEVNVSEIKDKNDKKETFSASSSNDLETGIHEDWSDACLELINQERKKKGIAELSFDAELQEAVNIRAEELTELFSHTRPDDSGCFTVLEEIGAEHRGLKGENIAAGQTSPEAAVKSWMNSPGHKANILTKGYKRSAIGFYYDPDSSYRYYWVQMFSD